MRREKLISSFPYETRKIAQDFAKEVLKTRFEKAILISLEGELGSGKTTFVKAFAFALGVKNRVTSPSFVLMKRYPLSHSFFKNLYHIDCYRVEKEQEIKNLGWEKIIEDKRNIVVVEWGDKIKNILPQRTIRILLKFRPGGKREIEIIWPRFSNTKNLVKIK